MIDKKSLPPAATPAIVSRADYEESRRELLAKEKDLTHQNDAVSAARRRLPMVQVQDYRFAGPHGPVALVDLFADCYLLMVQNVMFAPDWAEGCPHCAWATDQLPANMERLVDEGIAFAMVSEAPVGKLQRVADQYGWAYTWVSSGGTSYARDWGWWDDSLNPPGPVPGFSYYLLHEGRPYLTYSTTGRGVEAQLPVWAIRDRTCYGRQEEWEDSPAGWPQHPLGS